MRFFDFDRMGVSAKNKTMIVTLNVLVGLMSIFTFLAPTSALGQSEHITFQNGGAITGVIVPEKNLPADEVLIHLREGGALALKGDFIRHQEPISAALSRYRATAPFEPDTIESHLTLARWCKQQGLSVQANRHYQRILEIDPDHEETHTILQHVKEGGIWINQTAKERLEQKGYIRYAGRTLTLQEKQLEEQREKFKEDESRLSKEIKKIYKDLTAGDPKGREDLRQIKSPTALIPLIDVFQKSPHSELRVLFVQTLGNIGTPAAMMELGVISMADTSDEVRMAAIDQIKRKPQAASASIEYYKRFLLSGDNGEVNRAGLALGLLERKDAIPFLIDALVTEHKDSIVVGSDQTGASFSSDGKLQGFSPGGGAQKKVITITLSNDSVLAGLLRTVAENYSSSIDFRYDMAAWQHWYHSLERSENFNARRDW